MKLKNILLYATSILSVLILCCGNFVFNLCMIIKNGVPVIENGEVLYNPDGSVVWAKDPIYFYYGLFLFIAIFGLCAYLWIKKIIK